MACAIALTAVSLFLSSVFSSPIDTSGNVRRDSVPTGYESPPYYPAPPGGWVSDWAPAYAKAYEVVSNMTLAEKVNVTTGTGIFMGPCVGQTGSALRFGIPNLCLMDSPLGIRNTDHNTAFPAGITVGATFDKELMYARGVALGEEARGKGVNVLMGPVVGPIGRKPRGGRNWEGFGADPTLQAIGGAQTIKGMQSTGVIATLKHFIGNEQEMYRMTSVIQRGYSSNIDDRTLHELYLWPFAEGVRAGVGSVMMAYNDVNGSACSQNSKLINGILKDELGFQGFVMTDWLSQIGGVSSALAGLDMAMPGDGPIPLFGDSYWGSELSRAVLNGTVPVDRLNDMVTRIVATWYKFGQDKDFPLPNFSSNTDAATGLLYPGAVFSPIGVVNQFVDVQGDHKVVARAIARDAITLLKNEDNALPLKRNDSLKIFGTDAGTNPDGINSCADKGCDKGVLTMGWGSGTSKLPYLNTPQEAIANASSNAEFFVTDSFPSNVNANPEDIAIVFINADSGENYITVEGNYGDRSAAGLYAWHNGDDLVKAAAAKFSKVVVVVHTVGPIILENWIDLPSVKSVVFAHLPGQEAGDSLVDVLFGDYSPSGHLPYTIPRSEDQYPSSVSLINQPFGQIQDTFTEGLYIDYRHFLHANLTPRYPFGHGLSYTTFNITEATISVVIPLQSEYPPTRPPKGPTPTYNNVIPPASEVAWPENFDRIWRYIYPYLDNPAAATSTAPYPYPTGYTTVPQPAPRAGGAEGGNPALWDVAFSVRVKVSNTGSRPGRAVAQLYVELPSSLGLDTPRLQLRQFEKTKTLAPGESEVLTMELTRKDLSVWDVVVQDWKAPLNGQGVKWYSLPLVALSAATAAASYAANLNYLVLGISIRAYFKWMPIRQTVLISSDRTKLRKKHSQVEMDDNLRIWRRLQLGSLLDVIMLDICQYNCLITDLFWNTDYVRAIANDASRTMMGWAAARRSGSIGPSTVMLSRNGVLNGGQMIQMNMTLRHRHGTLVCQPRGAVGLYEYLGMGIMSLLVAFSFLAGGCLSAWIDGRMFAYITVG